MRKSTQSRPAGKPSKPAKPPKNFPLFRHANGCWAKKIRGRLHYFGGWKDDPKGAAALNLWLGQRDDLLAGRMPRKTAGGLTVADLVNRFLTQRQGLVATRELQQATWNEYHKVCGIIVAQFGRNRLADDLAADDFEALRATFAKSAGPVRLAKLIQITRCLFKYGVDTGLLPGPVRYGPGFKRPSKSVLRRHRASKGTKLYQAEEIHKLLNEANPVMRTMILLGINAAQGNMDIARLEFLHVDLTAADGWGLLEPARGRLPRLSYLWVNAG